MKAHAWWVGMTSSGLLRTRSETCPLTLGPARLSARRLFEKQKAVALAAPPSMTAELSSVKLFAAESQYFLCQTSNLIPPAAIRVPISWHEVVRTTTASWLQSPRRRRNDSLLQ